MQERRKPRPQYDAIVIIPYTSRIQGVAGERIIERRRADVKLSSYSAMTTEAARIAYNQGAASRIIALGDETFGPNLPSTANLMLEQLVRHDVPYDAITPIGGLQDTNEQLDEFKGINMGNLLFVAMGFHKKRVEQIKDRNKTKGDVVSSEQVIFKHLAKAHANEPEKIDRIGKQLKIFTPKKLRVIETVVRTVNSLPAPLRNIGLWAFRKLRGGQTVTDFHSLTSAKKHREIAEEAIYNGQLYPGDVTA